MQKNILILGSGGLASECYQYLQEVLQNDNSLVFKGFLAPTNTLYPYNLEHYYLGKEDSYTFADNDYAIIAVADPKIKQQIFVKLKKHNVKLFNLISPRAFITESLSIQMGEGNIIAPFCTIGLNVKIGNCNLLNSSSSISHDCSIGDFNTISSGCILNGSAKIKDLNFMGTFSTLLPNASLENGCQVSAGSIIFKKFKSNVLLFGNPAKIIGEV